MAIGDPTMYKGYMGGHNWITHTDEGALRYIQKLYDIKTMLDVGCGPGGQLRVAKELGIEATGVDGDARVVAENDDVTIIEHDFTERPFVGRNYDLIWSVEFVEHVLEKYVPNILSAFMMGKYIFMTHAPPGKGGNHHVNCQDSSYWIKLIEDIGYCYSEEITNEIKAASTMEREFVKQNGLFFYRK